MRKQKISSTGSRRSARNTESEKPRFELPFDDPVLLDIWESHLKLIPQDMLRWIEGDDVRDYLWLWVGVMLWDGRRSFLRGFKEELAGTREWLTDEEKSRAGDDIDGSVWTKIREKLIGEAVKYHSPGYKTLQERNRILDERAQDLIQDKKADWKELWVHVSFNLVTRGSRGMRVTTPFYGKESSYDACHRVVLQLLYAVWTEMVRDEVNRTYFRDLLQIQVVSVEETTTRGTESYLSLFPFNPQNMVGIWRDNIAENTNQVGVEHIHLIRWANAEYVEKIVCDWWQEMIEAGEMPSFLELFETKLRAEDGEWDEPQREEMKWINMREALYPLPAKLERLPGNRWPEVTEEKLCEVKGWKHPWIKATLRLLIEGSTHMSPERPFYPEGLSMEDCAETCIELLKAVYEDIKKEGQHWSGIFYRRKEADVQTMGISAIAKEDGTPRNSDVSKDDGSQSSSGMSSNSSMSSGELAAMARDLNRASCAPSNDGKAAQPEQQPRKSNKRRRGAADENLESPTPKRKRKAPPSQKSNPPKTPQCRGKKRSREADDEASQHDADVPMTPGAKRTKTAPTKKSSAPSRKSSTPKRKAPTPTSTRPSIRETSPTDAMETSVVQEAAPVAAAERSTSPHTPSLPSEGPSYSEQAPTPASAESSMADINTTSQSQQISLREADRPDDASQPAAGAGDVHIPTQQQVQAPPSNDPDYAHLYRQQLDKNRLLQVQIGRLEGALEHQDNRIATLTLENRDLACQLLAADGNR